MCGYLLLIGMADLALAGMFFFLPFLSLVLNALLRFKPCFKCFLEWQICCTSFGCLEWQICSTSLAFSHGRFVIFSCGIAY